MCVQVWLLEINASPSLTANTAADHALKCGLLDDVMTIIDFDSKCVYTHIDSDMLSCFSHKP